MNENFNIKMNAVQRRLYSEMAEKDVLERLNLALDGFIRIYGYRAQRLFSAPGRTELGGNHTDHQRGLVVAAAVELDSIAAVSPNGGHVMRIFSEAFGLTEVELDMLSPQAGEAGSPAALARGVAEYLTLCGFSVKTGFDAFVSARVPVGSGLSSSAAFEVLVAAMINGLDCGGKIPPETMARAGQYAENTHFGKPCGLMDQMASAVGGVVGIDFADPEAPRAERLSVDFSRFGYVLAIIDTGAQHDHLGDEYAAIPAEMTSVAGQMNAQTLSDIQPGRFFDELPRLRKKLPDRALLRAVHFFEENARVISELDALKHGDFERFLSLVRESGYSSWMLLQNIYPSASVQDQSAALALTWCRRLLGGAGACRIHGGGFGGTIQAYVPLSDTQRFKEQMELLTGAGSCRFLKVRNAGAVEITLQLIGGQGE